MNFNLNYFYLNIIDYYIHSENSYNLHFEYNYFYINILNY